MSLSSPIIPWRKSTMLSQLIASNPPSFDQWHTLSAITSTSPPSFTSPSPSSQCSQIHTFDSLLGLHTPLFKVLFLLVFGFWHMNVDTVLSARTRDWIGLWDWSCTHSYLCHSTPGDFPTLNITKLPAIWTKTLLSFHTLEKVGFRETLERRLRPTWSSLLNWQKTLQFTRSTMHSFINCLDGQDIWLPTWLDKITMVPREWKFLTSILERTVSFTRSTSCLWSLWVTLVLLLWLLLWSGLVKSSEASMLLFFGVFHGCGLTTGLVSFISQFSITRY